MKSACCDSDVYKNSHKEPIKCSSCNLSCNVVNETSEEMIERKRDKTAPDFVTPNSFWLVVYECRYAVIKVSPFCDGFFATGQEPLWGFDSIQEWLYEIKPENHDKNYTTN